MTASVMSAVCASNEIFVSTVCAFSTRSISFAAEYIRCHKKKKQKPDSGQSPKAILYSAVNKKPNVYMLYANCRLTSV